MLCALCRANALLLHRCWTLSAAITALLDHKGTFSDHAAALDLLVPKHHVVTSPQQLQELNSEKVRATTYSAHSMRAHLRQL